MPDKPIRILAVDTATESCSAACLVGDEIYQRSALDPQGHSRLLLGMIEEMLKEARVLRDDLDAIVYDCGPGSFTGIRIGAGVAQGLAMGLNKPLLAVSSLMTLAEAVDEQAKSKDRILAAIDARMEQVYWGCLEQDDDALGGWRWHEHPRVSDPDTVREFVTGCTGIGSGWDRYAAVFQSSEKEEIEWRRGAFPDAADGARIARRLLRQGVKGEWHEAMPAYVRNDVTD
ncbi:MAG: tRNA (adenosine(37)-N6)-threonylcarbamoyltransferase complex dimerization subunit type 1 TsaB [Acidiferrobacteraceae bacterium]|jgi:tRNA threonylcarbamoyladenosine biosynthesis protein TsaB|nr:tRNA (adenosine(37)-N6)-threonylcarbamoyltransferase complex dimerization subunit type 1 TsaB [Acidiferrobacteraceae bacterium]MDP6919831.1 tRNA (adenosine(37)-N6)-threonylcarbamoyltransferase complex dimerization subunit type 1 TsaB [Arenicellales bacterium]|tara:strand:+ start:845 stop:1534 length:690 start_codon:yes stop_codon:yes gene_type:complete